jgi:hypothetical protein
VNAIEEDAMSALIYPPARLDINHFASPEQIAAVRRPLNQAALLPASFYADPQSHAFDVEKLFMRHWLPVARTTAQLFVDQYER